MPDCAQTAGGPACRHRLLVVQSRVVVTADCSDRDSRSYRPRAVFVIVYCSKSYVCCEYFASGCSFNAGKLKACGLLAQFCCRACLIMRLHFPVSASVPAANAF